MAVNRLNSGNCSFLSALLVNIRLRSILQERAKGIDIPKLVFTV